MKLKIYYKNLKGTPGFTGARCEFCDSCTPNPCQNGGQCQSSGIGGGFRCICPPGFIGIIVFWFICMIVMKIN